MIKHRISRDRHDVGDRRHDLSGGGGVEAEDAVEDGDLVVPEGFLAVLVEGEERFELSLLVRVLLVGAEDVVEQLGDRPGDRLVERERERGHHASVVGRNR